MISDDEIAKAAAEFFKSMPQPDLSERNCLRCQKRFKPKREHGKFCSGGCRIAYFRKVRKLRKKRPISLEAPSLDGMEIRETLELLRGNG